MLWFVLSLILCGAGLAWLLLAFRPLRDAAYRNDGNALAMSIIGSLIVFVAGGGLAALAVQQGSVVTAPTPTSKPSPTPSGSQSVATSSPGVVVDVPALPDAYVGTWRGSAHSFSPQGDYSVVITFQSGSVGSTVGQIDRPSLPCSASLTLDRATNQSIKLTEQSVGSYVHICRFAGGAVVQEGTQIVVTSSGAALDFKEYFNGATNSPTATATLSKG